MTGTARQDYLVNCVSLEVDKAPSHPSIQMLSLINPAFVQLAIGCELAGQFGRALGQAIGPRELPIKEEQQEVRHQVSH